MNETKNYSITKSGAVILEGGANRGVFTAGALDFLIQLESGIQVRYRYDWHIGAMPERYTYDKTGQKQPLNELALDLIPGDYGRAVCNGRFRDWDTGVWYYVLDILNVMPLAEPTDALTSFMDREPNNIYTQIDRLW